MLSRLRLTQGPLTGQVLFVKLNCVLRAAGAGVVGVAARAGRVRAEPGRGLGDSARARADAAQAADGGARWSEDILVYGEAGVSAGRKKPRHPVYLGLLPAARGGWSDITEQYVARFGLPEPGKKIIICTRQQRNGWEDYA